MKSQAYAEPRWRVQEMLSALGTYNEISRLLERKGYPRVPRGTISSWASRGSIPPAWLPAIIDLALDARLIGSIEDLQEKANAQH